MKDANEKNVNKRESKDPHKQVDPNQADAMQRPENDPRLTAYALDEVSPAERTQIEALLEGNAEARAHVEELRSLGRTLETTLAKAPETTPLSSQQREAILAAAGAGAASTAANTDAPRGRLLTSTHAGGWFKSPLVLGTSTLAAALLGAWFVGFIDFSSADSGGTDVATSEMSEETVRFLDQLGYGAGASGAEDAGAKDSNSRLAPGESRAWEGLGYVGPERSDQRSESGAPAETSGTTQGGQFRGPGNTVPPGGSRATGKSNLELEESNSARGWAPQLTQAVPEDAAQVYYARTTTAQDAKKETVRIAGQLNELQDSAVSDGPRAPGTTRPTSGPTSGRTPGAAPGAAGTPGLDRVRTPRLGADPSGTSQLQRLGYVESSSRVADRLNPVTSTIEGEDREDLIRARRQRENNSGEAYDRLPENPFVHVLVDSRSTFSIDVDTASYANVRRHLRQGTLPPQAAVRVEEMINAFSYSYAGPTDGHPFAVHAEIVEAPWAAGHKLLRIGLQGQMPSNENPVGRNLVFLVDVSGSMNNADKLPLVQRSLELLVGALQPQDTIGLVTYAGNSGIALQPTPVSEKEIILAAVQGLRSGGSTNGAAGIVDAYRLAQEHFVEGGVNRVVLATDGDFNVGVQSRDGLEELIAQKRATGVFLSVLGFGQGNLKDSQMEAIADKGNGNYSYIDSVREARKVLVRNLDGTLETIAKDVKLQLEFNPARVQSFRLIGYENRVLAHRDFNNDKVDAGEIGAGHSVTALYELIPVGADLAGTPPLRYQQAGIPSELSEAAHSGEALTVQLRYKRPDGDKSILLSVAVLDSDSAFAQASQETRFAAAVASFGMQLRGSEHVGSAGLEAVRLWAKNALGADPQGDRREFLTLVDWAIQATLGSGSRR